MLTGPVGPAGPPASLPPKRRFGRRINRVPALIFIAGGCIVAGAVTYTLYERSQDELRRRQLTQAAPSGADASGVLKDAPSGWIPPTNIKVPPQAPYRFQPAPVADQASPGPAKEKEPQEDDREKARKAAWVLYWDEMKQLRKERFDKRHEAVFAMKTSVESGAPPHSGGEETAAPAAHSAGAAVSTPSGGQGGWGTPGGGGFAGLWGGGGFGGYGQQTPQIDREGQEQKITFARQQGDLGKDDVVPTVRKPPDRFAVLAGSFVKFTTVNEVNSDVPGLQIGRVTESVYNHDGTCILIPQNSTLIGHYDSVVSIGQGRLPAVITRINFPDGSWQSIGAMETADNAGSAGEEDIINRHLIQKFGAVFLATLPAAAIQLSIPQNNNNNGYSSQQIIASTLGLQMSQLAQEIARQQLSIPNTLMIRAGFNGTMIPSKNIHVEPAWECSGTRQAGILPIMQVGGH